MSNSVFVDMVKALKDEDVNFAFERRHSGEFSGYIDTGSYLLNGQISGSMYGGMPNNKVWAIAGETTTGKTFFALGVVKFFLDSHPDAACFYYDTEAALTADMLEERGIDSRRIIIGEPATIQEFRHKVITVLNRYKDIPKKDRPPMFMVLDSMGNLSSTKEVEDTESGVETRDMTKSQLLRATWRVIRLKLAKVDVAMIVTNHTYMGIGLYASKEMSGGGGLAFASDQITFLSKKKDQDGNIVVGTIIKCQMKKSRLSRENTTVEIKLSYDTGLDRYYGLIPFAEAAGAFEKLGNKYIINEKKYFEKEIYKNPEKFFTEEVMAAIEIEIGKTFNYGTFEEEGEAKNEQTTEESVAVESQ